MSKSTGCRNEPSTSENDTMTMRMRFLFAALTLALAAGSCSREPRTELFNGRDLTGWVCVTDPEGVGDARDAFSVQNGNIRIAGSPFGYMRTEETYDDYRLHVEWRWIGEATNSGIFQRVQAGDRLWPEAVECQLQAGRAGDLLGLGGAKIAGAESNGRVFIKPRSGGGVRAARRRMELCRDRLRGRSYRGLCQRRFAERVHRIGPQRVYRASERGRSRGVPQHLADPLETRDLGCGWRLRLALVTNTEHANKGCSPLFACSYVRVFVQNPGMPLEAVLKRLRKQGYLFSQKVLTVFDWQSFIACSGTRTTDSPRAGGTAAVLLRPPTRAGGGFPRGTGGVTLVFLLLAWHSRKRSLLCCCVGCHQKYRKPDDVAGVLPFFPQKVPKNLPADAFAYFVPSNVGSGRPPKRRV